MTAARATRFDKLVDDLETFERQGRHDDASVVPNLDPLLGNWAAEQLLIDHHSRILQRPTPSRPEVWEVSTMLVLEPDIALPHVKVEPRHPTA